MTITLNTQKNRLETFPWDDAQPDSSKSLEGLTHQNSWVPTENKNRHIEVIEYTWPQFGPARCYLNGVNGPFVVEIGDRRWEVTINMEYDEEHPIGGSVTFEETTKSITPVTSLTTRRYGQIFGQPKFIQNEVFPQYKGKSASILAVIESGWGDAGNENLFLALDKNNLPAGLFHEANCC